MDGFTWLTGNAITGTLTALALGLLTLLTVGALDALIEWVALRHSENWREEGNVPPRWWR
jgi:hypothetical protein